MTKFNSLLTFILFGGIAFAQTPQPIDPMEHEVTQGALRVKTEDEIVECPLKHTDVKAIISGFIARVTVTQTFENPFDEKIEAVYVFPLPHTAAVDDMTMVMGARRIVGLIKRRDEARAVYERAIEQGATASLLEQERPNIFTQSVGNIKPGEEIHIEISYVDVLNYDMGSYEFHFPMVVGPRYIPGTPISKKPEMPKELKGKVSEAEGPEVEGPMEQTDPCGTGWSPDTTRVPDASRITPPVLKPGYRTGHDISLSVSLEAGVPIKDIKIVNHKAMLKRIGASGAVAEISTEDSIPNRDFVMKYAVVGEKPEMAVLAHSKGADQGYFMLMIQPKLDEELAKAPPREVVFLVDVSGSMSGEPTEKVKEAMRHFFRLSKPNDTVQVITFAGSANKLFERPVAATEENVSLALNFSQQIRAGGGTEMLKGIRMVLNEPVDPERVRIVVMLTDGYIGNEAEIIAEVGRRAGDQIRFWAIGIGSSPNRLLIDGVAKQGGGMSGVIELNTDPKELVSQIVERIHRAQLAKIRIDWNELSVSEIFPRRIPELWAGRPVILFGRYAQGGKTRIKLTGVAEGKPLSYSLDVTLPREQPKHGVLSKIWARKKIEDISAQMYYANTPEVVEEITQVALAYRLMSQYTSFVAVDETEVQLASQKAKPPRQVLVPVPLPAGVEFDGIFGGNVALKADASVSSMRSSNLGSMTYSYSPASAKASSGGRALRLNNSSQYGQRTVTRPSVARQPMSSSASFSPTPTRKSPLKAAMRSSVIGQTSPPGEITRIQRDAARAGLSLRMVEHQDLERALFDQWSMERREDTQSALKEAKDLQNQGEFEAARLRYQHVLGLQADMYGVNDTVTESILTVTEEIGKRRAQAYPRLNRKLDLVIRNQPLDDAIRTVVEAGEFQLELVNGSLQDAAELLNLPELRVTYLDLRHATMIQALDWLLAPYHLTWQMKDADTITICASRRLPAPSAWGYAVADLVIPSEGEIDNSTSEADLENALTEFLNGVRIVINQKEDSGHKPESAVLIDAGRLLVYGESDTHAQVMAFLEALRDNKLDVVKVAGRDLSSEERASLKALQKLTAKRWKMRAKAREDAAAKVVREYVKRGLREASWWLLAEAVRGGVDLEALTKLQMAWDNPQIKVMDPLLVTRAAWCIGMAARAVPDDDELTILAEKALSTVNAMNAPKPKNGAANYLASLCTALLLDDRGASGSQADEIVKSLMLIPENSPHWTTRLIAQGWFSPSTETDASLMKAISARRIQGDDSVILVCLVAKRRGGQLWQTFREEMPSLVRAQPLNGHVVVLVNRLEASPLLAIGMK
jgi:Ca-activated chloride channel family protein